MELYKSKCTNDTTFLETYMNTRGSFEFPFCNDLQHTAFIEDCVLMAIVNRISGNVARLGQYSEWKKSNRIRNNNYCLPCIEEVNTFVSFIMSTKPRDKSLNCFISKQHFNAVPKYFRNKHSGKKRFCDFIIRLTTDDGVRAIVQHIFRERTSNEGISRVVLKRVIEETMILCAPCLQKGQSLSFIAHHVIADLESVYPEFAGEVSFDSIGFGYGSLFGLTCLTRDIKSKSKKMKFEHLHRELIGKILTLDKKVLSILGWEETNGKITSIITGREFSMTDTEHVCCKVYVSIANSHPSRTISETPSCFAGYCWPLPTDYTWADQHEEMFSRCLKLFRDATFKPDCSVGKVMRNFPHQLTYQEGVYL